MSITSFFILGLLCLLRISFQDINPVLAYPTTRTASVTVSFVRVHHRSLQIVGRPRNDSWNQNAYNKCRRTWRAGARAVGQLGTAVGKDDESSVITTGATHTVLNHGDIEWKIRLPPEVPAVKQAAWKAKAQLLKLTQGESKIHLPPADVSRLVVLEAWTRKDHPDEQQGGKIQQPVKLGRFGITVHPGPLAAPIQNTVQEIYGPTNEAQAATAGAIIYMFVEEDYRKKNIGALAFQVIAYLQALENCNYTILVADDNGSGKLVQWYERYGFSKAPGLQEFLGSPNGTYGITMIAPTAAANININNNIHGVSPPDDCKIEWW